MFIIIGGDGKEYGPVTVEQIRSWLTAGRANLETKAKAIGSDEWRRIGDYAEFSGDAVPPTLSAGVGAVGAEADLKAQATEPASRGLRLGAYLLDRLIESVCLLPGLLILGAPFLQLLLSLVRNPGEKPDVEPADLARMGMGFVVLMVCLLAVSIVQIVMLSTRGQTIAKRILGLRIVRYANGGKVDFVSGWLMRSFVPGVLGAIPYIGFVFALVDYCMIFGEQRRCLHDLMAGTKVIKI
jgi:uncharacterized RDD family membrane protein YckC